MKRLIFLLCAAVLISADKNPQQKYIDTYSLIAVREMERSGVPASITLAQGLLESRAGQSPLAVDGNNHFGIKCHSDWKGKKMYHDDDRSKECFRVYLSAELSFRDHSDFLRYSDRYKSLFDLERTDYKGWARGLKKAGYATDPHYAEKLIKAVEDYELYRFDTQAGYVPEAPLAIEAPKKYEPVEKKVALPEYREELQFSLTREVLTRNGVPFIVAVKGETYRSIAAESGLFLKELLLFNDLKSEENLQEGSIVYIHIKKMQAERGLDKYIVGQDGEELRDIAQRFGLRLTALRKLNGFDSRHVLKEGDSIRLR